MSIFSCFNSYDASVDGFAAEEFVNSSLWSIDVDTSNLTDNGAKYTILVSNHSIVESEMKELALDLTSSVLRTSLVPINELVSAVDFKYKYIGFQYESNGSTGTITVYFNKKQQLVKIT